MGLSQPILFCAQGSEFFVISVFATILTMPWVSSVSCIMAMDLMVTKHVPQGKQPHFMYLNKDKYMMPSFNGKALKSRTIP